MAKVDGLFLKKIYDLYDVLIGVSKQSYGYTPGILL